MGYGPQGCKHSERTEVTHTHQLLGLRVCTAQDPGLIPGQETKMPQSHAEVKKKQNTVKALLKSRDITVPIKAHIVEAMVFPVIMYG